MPFSLVTSTRGPVRQPFVWIWLAALLAATAFGASQLAFLCDDAFIHFRYAANAHDGRGLVWNPAPFAPVEGAGFLWVLVLWAIWSWFGIEPPAAANGVSLACGLALVGVLAAAALALVDRHGRRLPPVVGLLALTVVVANRTFLQWLSGGLDTALFNLPFVAWVLLAFRSADRRGAVWLGAWSALAALAALTRPDGLPAVAATAGVGLWSMWRGELRPRAAALGLAPLLLNVAHVAWRKAYYGDWLPNTFQAKVAGPWPEAGLRYAFCFAVENGAWLWPLVLSAGLAAALRRSPAAAARAVAAHLPATAAVGTVLFHAGYYCFVVGGDHFEYRVLSQLVPLGTLAAVATAGRIGNGVRPALATAVALLLSGSFGWVHLALTSDPAFHGVRALTPQVPAPLRPLVRIYDRQQAWLFFRYVGLRCNHHALQLAAYTSSLPPRRRFVPAELPDPYPIMPAAAAGRLGWVLPDCYLIDVYGLNDWVVARSPRRFGEPMSRERLRPAVLAADRDGDGHLDLEEFRSAVAVAIGGDGATSAADFLLTYLMSLARSDHPDRIPLAEAVAMGDIINTGRLMAHECQPLPGYVEAFAPNVTVGPAGAIVTPRPEPMTAVRIQAIEREWRQRILAPARPR